MALKQLRFSDVSGEPIPEGTGARVRIMFFDRSIPDRRADMTDGEVEALLGYTQPVEGRPDRRGGPHSSFDS